MNNFLLFLFHSITGHKFIGKDRQYLFQTEFIIVRKVVRNMYRRLRLVGKKNTKGPNNFFDEIVGNSY